MFFTVYSQCLSNFWNKISGFKDGALYKPKMSDFLFANVSFGSSILISMGKLIILQFRSFFKSSHLL